jgi:hypothetical protein
MGPVFSSLRGCRAYRKHIRCLELARPPNCGDALKPVPPTPSWKRDGGTRGNDLGRNNGRDAGNSNGQSAAKPLIRNSDPCSGRPLMVDWSPSWLSVHGPHSCCTSLRLDCCRQATPFLGGIWVVRSSFHTTSGMIIDSAQSEKGLSGEPTGSACLCGEWLSTLCGVGREWGRFIG